LQVRISIAGAPPAPTAQIHVKPDAIASFDHLLEAERGDVLLRFSRGHEYLKMRNSPTGRSYRGSRS
jgi:hypothetical protein